MSHHKHLRTAVLSVLAITCLATAAFATGGPGSNFDGVEVTGSINVVRNNVPVPVNFWDVNEASGPATIFHTAWLNVALNSTTVPIKDDAIEFGFGRIVDTKPQVNVTVTLDIEGSGRALYQVACTAPANAGCIVTQPFTVTINIRSNGLIGGSFDLLFNNASDLFVPVFDAELGTFAFTAGPLDEVDPGSGGVIEGGDVRQIIFQLNEAGRCTAGECCDTKASKILPRGIVCRGPTSQCSAAATCDGETAICPASAPEADGKKCLWDPNAIGVTSSPLCAGTTVANANTASGPSSRCTGQCQAGICTLDCSRGQCCTTPGSVVIPTQVAVTPVTETTNQPIEEVEPQLPTDVIPLVQTLGQLGQVVGDQVPALGQLSQALESANLGAVLVDAVVDADVAVSRDGKDESETVICWEPVDN